MEERFRKNYKGLVRDDFEEDFVLFKSIKRTTNSFMKNPNTDKLHSIYNKIFVLKRLFHESFLFGSLVENNDNKDAKNLIAFILSEVFDGDVEYEESSLDELWTIHVSDLLENTKIKPRT